MVRKRLCIDMPEVLFKGLEELVRRRVFDSKSEAVRIIIYSYLRGELWGNDGYYEDRGGKRHRIVV